jgi:hypothetical protein
MRYALVLVVALSACAKKKSEGLKPADDWNVDRADVIPPGTGPTGSPHDPHVAIGAGDPDDPHAGVDMTGGGQDNPHAGVDMTGAGGANPHGGGDPHAGVDMSKVMPPPDPNRPIDPAHHIKGVLKLDPKAKAKMKPGTAVFVFAELPGPDGNPQKPPLAVQRLTWDKDELPFELSEANAMVAGTQLTGDVFVIAHYDQDGDATSKQPGDVLGQLKVKIPADNVRVMLDNVIP